MKKFNGSIHWTMDGRMVNDDDEDLVINGLGFVKIVNKGVIDVYIDKDIDTFMRKSLI